MQEEMLRMKQRFKEKSFKFSKQVADRAVVATKNAEQKIEEWERGEGPEAFTVLARGEGLTAAAEVVAEQLDEVEIFPEEDVQISRSSGEPFVQQRQDSVQQVTSGATSATAASGTGAVEAASGA